MKSSYENEIACALVCMDLELPDGGRLTLALGRQQKIGNFTEGAAVFGGLQIGSKNEVRAGIPSSQNGRRSHEKRSEQWGRRLLY
jgi:hypothetical protein